MFCATVLYPLRPGATLDVDHYARTLAPMYADFLGDNCAGFEVRRGLETPGAPTPQFGLIASYWVKSQEAYGQSLSDPRFPGIMAKFNEFTDVEPVRQFDETLGSPMYVERSSS